MLRQKKDYLKVVSYKARYLISVNGLHISCSEIIKGEKRIDLYLGDHIVTSIFKGFIKEFNYDFESDDTVYLQLVMK